MTEGQVDWIALYGAVLATLIAVANTVKWLTNGPKLSVTVFRPSETGSGHARTFLAIVSNCGNQAVVVQSLNVSFQASRWAWSQKIGQASFDEKSKWKPSVKLVPVDGKPNTSTPVPNVLGPNEEIRALATAISEYDESKHWIRVSAQPRNSRKLFAGLATPARSESKGDNR